MTNVAAAGRSIRVSPDGKYAAYETGAGIATVTRIISLDDPAKVLLEIKGRNFVFSPLPNSSAFLRIAETPDIAALRKDIEKASAQSPPDRQAMMARQRRLAWLEAKAAEIVL